MRQHNPDKERQAAEVAKQVEEFLAKGGKIQTINRVKRESEGEWERRWNNRKVRIAEVMANDA